MQGPGAAFEKVLNATQHAPTEPRSSSSLSPFPGEGGKAASRRVRICYFNTWAKGLEESSAYVARIPFMDLAPLVSNPGDKALLAKARLDCDWYGENTRAFGAMESDSLEFLPAWVCGPAGVLDVARVDRAPNEERWLVTMGHQPQSLGPLAGRLFALLAASGVRLLFYAFDEASRCMPCFKDIAPHLDVLIHDESPLNAAGEALLKATCRRIHRSWVANMVPYSVPFLEAPLEKVLFLGSELGLTPHRQRQIRYLRGKLGDRFVAIHDHSVAVADRASLRRFKVGLCPEGRKFTTPAMAATHTDRPFWSGCCGIVPVSEDSRQGGRLDDLRESGLIVPYAHGDLPGLLEACERALSMGTEERRRIYHHFNRGETVGRVVAEAIAEA